MFLENGEVIIFSPRHHIPPGKPDTRYYQSLGFAKLVFTCKGLSISCYPGINDDPENDYNNDELRLKNFFMSNE